MEQTQARLLDIVAKTFRVARASINLESSQDTIATWDSLHHVQLILALEEEFNVQFEFDEIPAMQSVAIIDAMLRERVGERLV